jgi:hypothetical protein
MHRRSPPFPLGSHTRLLLGKHGGCERLPEPMAGQTGFAAGQTKTSDNFPCDGGGPWSSWEALGGQLNSAPSAVAWGCDRIDVVALGTNNAVYWISWTATGGWTPWGYIGGEGTSAPAISSWAPGRLDVFVRGTNGGLYHAANSGGGWTGFEHLGGQINASSPLLAGVAAVSWDTDRIDAFVRGTSGDTHRISWNGTGWSSWSAIPGSFYTYGPSATSWGPYRLDLYSRHSSGATHHTASGGGPWIPWEICKGRQMRNRVRLPGATTELTRYGEMVPTNDCSIGTGQAQTGLPGTR